LRGEGRGEGLVSPANQSLARNDDLAGGQANQIDGPGKLGRAGIKGRHDAIADAHRAVPVTERQIIGPGGSDFFIAEDPGRAQRIGPGLRRLVMPVRHRHLPARRARPRSAQGRHIEVIPMRMPPDFEIIRREGHRLVVCDAEDVDIPDAVEPAANENRIRQGRIVVAGQDHDLRTAIREQPTGTVENCGVQLIVLECVADQQHDVCSQISPGGQHGV
jgi:hypothetical protein